MAQDTRPQGARVSEAMIGSSTGEITVQWDERDSMLYALGVGAGLGAPDDELHYTTENSAGVTLRTVPSYLSVLTMVARPPALDQLDQGRFLHAEQWFTLNAPLTPKGAGVVVNQVERVLDKGTGAIIVNRASLRALDDHRLLGEVRSSIFVRGAGGFGGDRGDGAAWELPARAPDAQVEQRTHVEQPLLYRLSGDRHRLHSDPVFAREWGFDRPIMHGLCTYGMACRAIVAGAAAGDPTRLIHMDGRFKKPVLAGDTLITQMWVAPDGGVQFRVLDGAGDIVLDRGRAQITR